MSTLSSSSTLDEIKDSYADNASYEEDGSASKASAFITACRLLLMKLPKRAKRGPNQEIELDPAVIANELASAKRWLATAPAASSVGGVKYASVNSSGFRG